MVFIHGMNSLLLPTMCHVRIIYLPFKNIMKGFFCTRSYISLKGKISVDDTFFIDEHIHEMNIQRYLFLYFDV